MISIEKWAGLVTNASPYAIPPGAAVTQINLQAISPGQLVVRPGLQAVTFAATVSATQPIISAFAYRRAGAVVVVHQDVAGNVFTTSAMSGAVPPPISGVPGVPQSLTATFGNASATLGWQPPSLSGGGAITGYSVQLSTDAGVTWSFAAATTDATASISGLTNGTSYVFRVAATNAFGRGDYTPASSSGIPVGPPQSPQSLAAAAGNSQVSLTWSAPASNGGAAITDYVVEYSANGGSSWIAFNDGTSTSTAASVTGLTNGAPYVFRVAAVNSAGQSDYASYMTPVLPLGVPDAPTGLTATYGNAQVSLAWQAAAANHPDGITRFTVQQSSDGGATWAIAADNFGAETVRIIQGLSNGTSYRFRVSASNAVGMGPYGTAVGPVTPRTVPGAVTGLSATPGNASVSLTWTAPASNGGAAISDYKIEVSVNGSSYSTITRAASTATSYTATSLTNGSAYTYRVSAVNSEGPGATATSSAVTPQTVPGAPTAVLTTVGNGFLTVRWTAPADAGGSAITDYRVQYSSDDGATWTTFSDGTSTATQTNVTPLTNGTSYIFRVAAFSAVGMGLYSSPSSATTPVGPPGAPTAPLVTGGNTQMFASWTAPASNGGAAISGYVIQYRRTGVTTWTTFGTVGNVLSYTITGLTNGLQYVFRVAAVNSAGTGSYSAESANVTVGQVPATIASTAISVSSRYATSATDTTLTLAWTAPNSYGSTITDYLVQYATSDTGPWTLLSDGTSATTGATFTNVLNAATPYYFRVAAVSTVGPAAYSAAFGPQSVASVPSVSSLTASASAGRVTLSWTAASEGNAPITGGAVHDAAFNSEDGAILNVSFDFVNRTATVPACSGSFSYRLALRNFVGLGGYSSASSTVTAIDGAMGQHSIDATAFVDGNAVLDITLPSIIKCTATNVACEASTDGGSTWSAVAARGSGTLAYPTTPTSQTWKGYRGDGKWKVWVSPPPSSPFLLRTSLKDASGNGFAGTTPVATGALSVPAAADPLWDRILYLYDGNAQTHFRRQSGGTLQQSSTGTASGSAGRFGTMNASSVSFEYYRAGVPAYNAPASDPGLSFADLGFTCAEWWMRVPSSGSAELLRIPLTQEGSNVYEGIIVTSSSGAIVVRRYRAASSLSTGHTVATFSSISGLGGQMAHIAYEGTLNEGWLYVNGSRKLSFTFSNATAVASAPPDLSGYMLGDTVEAMRITATSRYGDVFLPPSAMFWHP